MTRDVTEMARDAGFGGGIVEFIGLPVFERFAELVRKDYSTTHANIWLDRIHKFMLEERKACEDLHDHEDVLAPVGNSAWGEAYQEGWADGTKAYQEAIRARGETK